MTASEIIAKFGTATSLARELDIPFTTVASWRQNNQIPAWRQPKLLELAAKNDIALSTADFPGKDDRLKPEQAAA